MRLNGTTVLITGASSGIGSELARQLADLDCRLILIARNEQRLQQLATELAAPGKSHIVLPCDVSKHENVKNVCQSLLTQDILPDVLILNAGMSAGFSAVDMNVQEIEYEFSVNFFSHLYFLKYLLPPMLERQYGLVAATGSLAGYRAMPQAAPYSASKAALAVFLEGLRVDLWSSGVKFCLISPGFVKTAMTEKHEFYMPFLMPVERAAKIIIRGLEREKPEIRFPYPLSILMSIIRFMPDNLYARLIHNARKIGKKNASTD